MKYIRTHSDNTIALVADKELPNTTGYSGSFPSDFYNTFSKGKYLFTGSEITLNPNWNEDNQEVLTLPEDLLHRTLLIEGGISSVQELQSIEDITTIPGIGEAKAEDINEYLTTNGA